MDYTGWMKLEFSDNELADYYEGKLKLQDYVNLYENEYLIITHNHIPIDNEVWKRKNNKLIKINYQTIGSNQTSQIAKPRNIEQYCEFDLINDEDIGVKLITGTWGAFKTGAFARAALDALSKNKFEKIIYIRNNVQTKDTDNLGALPGDIWDKLAPYVGPFVDAVGGDEEVIKDMVDHRILEVVPLGYLRGRNFAHSIIFVDEAENLTVEHIQLIIARAAEGSQIWINGDIRQRDKIAFERSPGIETLINKLKGNPLFGYVHLIKSERSAVAALADLLKE